MATKLRLQRRGRKNYPFYQIIVADSRAPRDGKYIERIGSYNPNTDPATITLDFDRALYWLQTGAQPTDTVRNILSREGVLMKKHLLGGVTKGAFSETEAEKRFEDWMSKKQQVAQSEKSKADEKQRAEDNERLEAEKEKNKARAEELAKKKAEEIGAELPAEKAEEAIPEKVDETSVKEETNSVEKSTKEKEEKPTEKKNEEAPVKEEKAQSSKEDTKSEEKEKVDKTKEA